MNHPRPGGAAVGRTEGLLLLFFSAGLFVPALANFVEPSSQFSTFSAVQEETAYLPCKFEPHPGQNIQQVSWFRVETENSKVTTKEQIILFHHQFGQEVFEPYVGKASLEKARESLNDATLQLRKVEVKDEGQYLCQVVTFPSGNFDIIMKLNVLISPVSSLDPTLPPLTEGSGIVVVATCTSWGRPNPLLSWDTKLNGAVETSIAAGGKVTTKYSVQPNRAMNGKQLDCLISHPSFPEPRRIKYNLVVHYAPDVKLEVQPDDWYLGMEGASLKCIGTGNPNPHNFTWSWDNGDLPDGVKVDNDTLKFTRPLLPTDAGRYHCHAENRAGSGTIFRQINVAVSSATKADFISLSIIAAAVITAVLLLVLFISVFLLNRYHKRKNKKLEMELNSKNDELSNISRQTSVRRLNSIGTDPRSQNDDPLIGHVDSAMRSSMSSLGENTTHYRDSRSTVSAGRGSDLVGRSPTAPLLKNEDDREQEENLHNIKKCGEPLIRHCQSRSSFGDCCLHPPLHPYAVGNEQRSNRMIDQICEQERQQEILIQSSSELSKLNEEGFVRNSHTRVSLGDPRTQRPAHPSLMRNGKPPLYSYGKPERRSMDNLDDNNYSQQLHVETFQRNSHGRYSLREQSLPPPLYPTLLRNKKPGNLQNERAKKMQQSQDSLGPEYSYEETSEEGDKEKVDDRETESSGISETFTSHFHIDNGTLRPKTEANGMILPQRGHLV
ncbi:nectin-4-like [Polypterus senegalus]|uniref:nectin-4-like n=1 Tax=Polypterus senegalus TaxID=55291 RepID=UPI0019631942|nr:nectin-4-like [Polypterus senegalus]